MNFLDFERSVTAAANSYREPSWLLRGKTEDGSLLVACFDEGNGVYSTVVANTQDNNNRIITTDAEPLLATSNGTTELRIAAVAARFMPLVHNPGWLNPNPQRRTDCGVAITIGYDTAISRISGTFYELRVTKPSDVKEAQAAYLGGVAITLL
ncbi:MAG: hypothetical protein ACREGD_00985 [Candidatus Saccharimonadales bacterium]